MKIGILLAAMKFQPDRMRVLENILPTIVVYPPNAPEWGKGYKINHNPKFLPKFRYLNHFSNCWNKRGWYKGETIYINAWDNIPIIQDWDYVWCIESDVWANEKVWKTLFDSTQNNSSDLLCIYQKTRIDNPDWIWWNQSPKWCQRGILCSMYRLSSRAFRWLYQDAIKNREIFSEVSLPSTIFKKGGSISDIDTICPNIYNQETFNWFPADKNKLDNLHLWHAVKYDI